MGIIKIEVNKMIGAKLREERERRGMTQDKLAAALDTDSSYISNIENGKRGVGPDVLNRYCRYFDISEDELRSYLPTKNKGGKYPPIVQMIIDEILAMPLHEQTRYLAEIQEMKAKQERKG